jgi:hypothetical protein
MAPRKKKKDGRAPQWRDMLVDIGYTDEFNVNHPLFQAQIDSAWKQTGWKKQPGRRFPCCKYWQYHDRSKTITAKTLAETPLSLKEQSWLTVMRMQYCNTLEGDGNWRCHLGDVVPGPFEGLDI